MMDAISLTGSTLDDSVLVAKKVAVWANPWIRDRFSLQSVCAQQNGRLCAARNSLKNIGAR
jgi:hypothetical protein